MKKALIIFLSNIALFLFFYLLISFYSTSFNIKELSDISRLTVVIFYANFALLMTVIILTEYKSD